MGSLPFVNFSQLRSFYAVAQEMSFTKAAKVLNIGQPTLTVQVRALERAYNVELFLRKPRGLELTDTGRALFNIVHQIFQLEEEAVEMLRSTRNELGGRLRIGTVGASFVMKLLAAFNRRHPLVQVTIDSNNSDAVVQSILDLTLDVAVVGWHGSDPRMTSLHLGTHEVIFFVNADHPWADKKSLPLHQLDGQRLVMREPGSMTRRALEEMLVRHSVKPKIVMEVSRDAVREAVAEGLGIGIISESEFRPEPHLRSFRLSDHKVYTHAYLIALKARREVQQISAFFAAARSLITETTKPIAGCAATPRPAAPRPAGGRVLEMVAAGD
jgi:aminoethylphosphonate catabolism LysR family transcriptional regulator